MASCAVVEPQIAVTVVVGAVVLPPNRIILTGTLPMMGAWHVEQGVVLGTHHGGNMWSCRVMLSKSDLGRALVFKFVMEGGPCLVWETCENRCTVLGSLFATLRPAEVRKISLVCQWNNPHVSIVGFDVADVAEIVGGGNFATVASAMCEMIEVLNNGRSVIDSTFGQISNAFVQLIASEPNAEKLTLGQCTILVQYCNKEWEKHRPLLPDGDFDKIVNRMNSLSSIHIPALSNAFLNEVLTLDPDSIVALWRQAQILYSQSRFSIDNGDWNVFDEMAKLYESKFQGEWYLLRTNPLETILSLSDFGLKELYDHLSQLWKAHTPAVPDLIFDLFEKEIADRNEPIQVYPFPTYWSARHERLSNGSLSPIDFVPVTDDAERASILGKFTSTLGTTAIIISVHRIQNYGYWQEYYRRVQRLSARWGSSNELILFHGSFAREMQVVAARYGHSKSICPCGSIGDGIYFAINSNYSHNGYVTKNSDGSKEMFVCRVSVGHTTKGRLGLKSPPPTFDSVTNYPVMYCIFDQFQAYAEYVIRYR
ncbi:hypothetical protein Pelo_16628 [Pelomyxa schiedti]|nr:hypothetical protein Pelo_16628 [Pelomyxa schiedti]